LSTSIDSFKEKIKKKEKIEEKEKELKEIKYIPKKKKSK
jgi:hypothetical protein